jgi:hypothetical protein
MMENRSFDHMLRGLTKNLLKINDLSGNEMNPDVNGELVKIAPGAM